MISWRILRHAIAVDHNEKCEYLTQAIQLSIDHCNNTNINNENYNSLFHVIYTFTIQNDNVVNKFDTFIVAE